MTWLNAIGYQNLLYSILLPYVKENCWCSLKYEKDPIHRAQCTTLLFQKYKIDIMNWSACSCSRLQSVGISLPIRYTNIDVNTTKSKNWKFYTRWPNKSILWTCRDLQVCIFQVIYHSRCYKLLKIKISYWSYNFATAFFDHF